MKIGFLIIASEVLDGKITDLNTTILATFLRRHHLEINEALVVRDRADDLRRGLARIFEENDVVVTSGGLGPTRDDITKETLAHFLGRELAPSPAAILVAEENYRRFGRTFPGAEHGYAYLPEGFTPLANATGFAPGLAATHRGRLLLSAPGVPREFASMLEDHLGPRLDERRSSRDVLGHVIVRTKNVPEEKIFGEVDPELWDRLEAFGEVSSLPILMGVDIGVKLRAATAAELDRKAAAVRDVFERSPIRPSIWSFGSESVEEKIVGLANRANLRFGFAESATGGLCAHRITGVAGSSRSFMGSLVCYDEGAKEALLGVSDDTLRRHTAVSAEVAAEMARGLAERLTLDVAIAVTGYAGPAAGADGTPVGTVFVGRAVRGKAPAAEVFHLKGDREVLKQRFSQAALYALLEEAEKLAGP
jgi:nicotinamide-nucleotide amidase